MTLVGISLSYAVQIHGANCAFRQIDADKPVSTQYLFPGQGAVTALGAATMGRFDIAAAERYVPAVGVHATLECDAILRMSASPHETLRDALSASAVRSARFISSEEMQPHVWLEASMSIDKVLRDSAAFRSPSALLDAYQSALESFTSNLDHEFFSHPLLSVLCVWVGEQDILTRLNFAAPHPLSPVSLGLDDSAARYCLVDASGGVAIAHPVAALMAVLVVLVVRSGSRQDESALRNASEVVSSRFGSRAVVILRVGEVAHAHSESLASVAELLTSQAKIALEQKQKLVVAEVEKLRKTVKSTLKSWFTSSPAPKSVLSTPSSILSFASPAKPARSDRIDGESMKRSASVDATGFKSPSPSSSKEFSDAEASFHKGPGTASRLTRDLTGANVGSHLAPDSVEYLSRYAADMLMLTGDFEGAVDAYRVLAADLMGATDVAAVCEASAVEHIAIALALAEGSKREVGSNFEKSVKLYAIANRRELAVRAAFRAVNYCIDAGIPESAAGILDRAIKLIFPAILTSRSSIDTFTDTAGAVLFARIGLLFLRAGRRRKASMYTYLSSSRLARQELYSSAALIARDIHSATLSWRGIREEIELINGHAELAAGRPELAILHFSKVMALARDHMDAETQDRAINGFFNASSTLGIEFLNGGWNKGANFPVVDVQSAVVITMDTQHMSTSGPKGNASKGISSAGLVREGSITGISDWRALENEILEDCESKEAVRENVHVGNEISKLPRVHEQLALDMKRGRADHFKSDEVAALEMKLQRLREDASAANKRRRLGSLVDTGAVVGEPVSIKFIMRNPLQFPVFIEEVSAVVILQDTLHDRPQSSQCVDMDRACNGLDGAELSIIPACDIAIAPCSDQEVRLDVVVHKAGRLRFVGARWTFSVGQLASVHNSNFTAPGYCVLERKGKRLNATRRQRASEVPLYEDDASLTLDVISSAPRLAAKLVSKHSDAIHDDLGSYGDSDELIHLELRVGELREVALVITNEGLEHVYAGMHRTDSPHLFCLADCEGVTEDCVLGSDSESPACPSYAGKINLDLHPGHTAEKCGWIYAPWPGRHELRALLAYGFERPRICRIRCVLHVAPSIKAFPRFVTPMRASFDGQDDRLPSNSTVNHVLIGIEIEYAGGNSGDETYQVDGVAVESNGGWGLKSIPEPVSPRGYEGSRVSSHRPNLRVNETATIFFALHRPKPGNESLCASDSAFDRLRLRYTVDSGKAGCQSDEGRTVVGRQDLDDVDRCKGHPARTVASRYFSLICNYKHTSETQAAEDFVRLTVIWSSSSRLCGELHMNPLSIASWIENNKDVSMKKNSSDSEGQHIVPAPDSRTVPHIRARAVLRSPTFHHFHRFGTATVPFVPATLPVDIYVSNLTDCLVDVSISTPAVGSIADGQRGRYWSGLVETTMRALPPRLQRRLCLTAVFDRPGEYVISDFKIEAKVREYESPTSSGRSDLNTMLNEPIPVYVEPSSVVVVDATESASDSNADEEASDACMNQFTSLDLSSQNA